MNNTADYDVSTDKYVDSSLNGVIDLQAKLSNECIPKSKLLIRYVTQGGNLKAVIVSLLHKSLCSILYSLFKMSPFYSQHNKPASTQEPVPPLLTATLQSSLNSPPPNFQPHSFTLQLDCTLPPTPASCYKRTRDSLQEALNFNGKFKHQAAD